ncbi:MAG TPA: protein kinase [Gemmatimonadales bacterium]|nr:protein kinase [Gemmatimonadales bacterium]
MSDLRERLQAALGDVYHLERELGGGGMSRVFVAEEVELKRKIVIKVLPPELAAGINTDRFRREVQLAASLQHPHVVPLFTAGSADQLLYYTMPFVKGESLRERLAREGELPVADAVRILRDVVDALAYAHGEGVVHRDIKPANVLLSGGHALVADFGVAKALSDAAHGVRLTSAGVAIGTPMYMAPEQAVADSHADHRVDIYAVGALAYEVLTGSPPFAGSVPQQVLAAQLAAPPEPILKRRGAIPPTLAAAVMRCLEKRPADRWQTAEQLLHQIEPLATPSGGTAPHPAISDSSGFRPAVLDPTTPLPATTPTVAPESRKLFGRWLLIAAAVLLAFAAGYAIMRQRAAASGSAGEAAPKSLVVLPFENLGAADDKYFADGITEEITSRLAAVPDLKVTSRTTAMQYKDTKKTVRQIGQELAAGYVLEGSVRWEKAGGQNRIRVTPQLIRVSDDSHIWADRYDAVLAEVFDVQSNIAEKVVAALGVALGEPAKRVLAARPTSNPEAYDYYLRGQEAWNRGEAEWDVRAATQALERAVALDSAFASAWALLSRTNAFIYWQGRDLTPRRLELARSAMERATAIAADAPETQLARGYYRYWGFRDYPAALQEFEAALRSRPEDADIIESIGLIQRRQGRWEDALATLDRASQLEPRSIGLIGDAEETA